MNRINIIIKVVYGNTREIQLESFDTSKTILEMKLAIQEKLDGNPSTFSQKLIYGGKICNDFSTLADTISKVENDSTVMFHLIIRNFTGTTGRSSGSTAAGTRGKNNLQSSTRSNFMAASNRPSTGAGRRDQSRFNRANDQDGLSFPSPFISSNSPNNSSAPVESFNSNMTRNDRLGSSNNTFTAPSDESDSDSGPRNTTLFNNNNVRTGTQPFSFDRAESINNDDTISSTSEWSGQTSTQMHLPTDTLENSRDGLRNRTIRGNHGSTLNISGFGNSLANNSTSNIFGSNVDSTNISFPPQSSSNNGNNPLNNNLHRFQRNLPGTSNGPNPPFRFNLNGANNPNDNDNNVSFRFDPNAGFRFTSSNTNNINSLLNANKANDNNNNNNNNSQNRDNGSSNTIRRNMLGENNLPSRPRLSTSTSTNGIDNLLNNSLPNARRSTITNDNLNNTSTGQMSFESMDDEEEVGSFYAVKRVESEIDDLHLDLQSLKIKTESEIRRNSLIPSPETIRKYEQIICIQEALLHLQYIRDYVYHSKIIRSINRNNRKHNNNNNENNNNGIGNNSNPSLNTNTTNVNAQNTDDARRAAEEVHQFLRGNYNLDNNADARRNRRGPMSFGFAAAAVTGPDGRVVPIPAANLNFRGRFIVNSVNGLIQITSYIEPILIGKILFFIFILNQDNTNFEDKNRLVASITIGIIAYLYFLDLLPFFRRRRVQIPNPVEENTNPNRFANLARIPMGNGIIRDVSSFFLALLCSLFPNWRPVAQNPTAPPTNMRQETAGN